jgi:hypothetical protein
VKPIFFVAVQLIVLSGVFLASVRHHPSKTYKALFVAAFLGVIGLDVWYLADYAYTGGFSL